MAIMNAIAITKTTINIVIQIGDNTPHQDQLITLVNFKTINTIVNKPVNPIPPDVAELSPISFFFHPTFLFQVPTVIIPKPAENIS